MNNLAELTVKKQYLLGKNDKKQARKANSSAFCIDLHRQTLMAMMGNDDNDGQ